VVFEVLIFPGFFVDAFVVVGGKVTLAKPLLTEDIGVVVMGAVTEFVRCTGAPLALADGRTSNPGPDSEVEVVSGPA
jgi:hypothetical protein